MMERKPKRQYAREFKIEAVEFLLRGNKTAFEIARDLGIRRELLYRWKREYLNDQNHSFPGTGYLQDPEEEQVRRLERELRATQEERDILKKALAIFSLPDRGAGKTPR